MAAKKKPKGFTPTPAPVAPAGTYDPGLDASRRAAGRGLLYTTQDTERDNERASTAYTAGVGQSDTRRGWSLGDLLTGKDRTQADLTTGRDRGKMDLATALSRSQEDTGRLSADLARGFQELGSQQTAKASSGAFVDTGSIQAAGATRGENQTREQGVINQGQKRFEDDNKQSGSRLDEDFGTGMSRSNEDYNTGVGRTNTQFDWEKAGLGTDYQYGVDDRATSLSRSLAEDTFFGQDTDAAKMQQATSSGLYSPPEKPKNEFSDAKGPFKMIVSHGLRFKMRPDGKREPAGVAGAGSP